ncbi:hypothetical protein HUT18_09125 [Streptomyces sp. NA04227]|uniref:hypothetical protein n=1 Tax=Streptomyces sp. NA04227 TaxID=2742136 RepID=UPI00159018A0|nr:hypothetical protein [Streptomyces sp. NA04227]QKW06541.1 hypothetical protein HUT18_09125 [Streptomyces sp. NA04227]
MSEILVNTSTAGIQQFPTVTELFGTHYLVCWSDFQDGTVKGQAFRADGTRAGTEFVVNEPGPESRRRILPAADNTGMGPVVVWIEVPAEPGGRRVKAQRLDQSRQRLGAEIAVSTDDVDPEHRPTVASLPDGGFLVVWVGSAQERRVRARRYGPDGAPVGAELAVNATAGFHERPVVTALGGGGCVVAWVGAPGVGGGRAVFRIFASDGTPVTGEVKPNLAGFLGRSSKPAVAALHKPYVGPDGQLAFRSHFALAYVRAVSEDTSKVYSAVYDGDGVEQVLPLPASEGTGITCDDPTVATLSNGRVLVAWTQKNAGAAVPSVRARIVSDEFGAIGGEVTAESGTAADRFQVRAAAVFDGGEGNTAFLTWADRAGAAEDPSEFAVRGRLLTVAAQDLLP